MKGVFDELISWNVNGLRAAVTKGFMEVLKNLMRICLPAGNEVAATPNRVGIAGL